MFCVWCGSKPWGASISLGISVEVAQRPPPCTLLQGPSVLVCPHLFWGNTALKKLSQCPVRENRAVHDGEMSGAWPRARGQSYLPTQLVQEQLSAHSTAFVQPTVVTPMSVLTHKPGVHVSWP